MIQNTFGIVWLSFWYILAIYLVVVTLGVQQFQARQLEDVQGQGKPFQQLRKLADREERAVAEVDRAELGRDSANTKVEQSDARAIVLTASATKKFAQFEYEQVRLADLESDLRQSRGEGTDEVQLQPLLDEIANQKKVFTGAYEEFVNANAEASAENDTLINLLGKLEVAETKLNDLQEKLDAIREGFTSSDLENLEKIERYELQKDQIASYAALFLPMPREILTLILTLSMGVFGSTIHVSRVMFSSKRDEVSGEVLDLLGNLEEVHPFEV